MKQKFKPIRGPGANQLRTHDHLYDQRISGLIWYKLHNQLYDQLNDQLRGRLSRVIENETKV